MAYGRPFVSRVGGKFSAVSLGLDTCCHRAATRYSASLCPDTFSHRNKNNNTHHVWPTLKSEYMTVDLCSELLCVSVPPPTVRVLAGDRSVLWTHISITYTRRGLWAKDNRVSFALHRRPFIGGTRYVCGLVWCIWIKESLASLC